ncbi:MAG TPA: CRISPR-associated endonuclease Cas2 [Pseudothermotoga sp.]|jgi:CRISPR-associated protein Cas2|nr:MAG: CRISPR-associated endoribonuclease Cas2 [Petrotoga mobilis]HBT26752.1 CRISPR-associated endonuclease Cas2 [Pseudothermotoga sp.]HOJ89275.1 CRISPR-associated endonuclease Cas2 [Pseudothermotoga sp.]HOK83188.1 CRISPR-associated endonuclease Cas2 [Pseudothermotoga sp.]HPP71086.1 CRISPR-associated endonuclease Cas2 [Pseudothermotoga sp.]
MLFVVSYDIVDDKRRKELSDYLESYGVRVQYSVFETELNQSQLNQMIKGIKKRIKSDEDTVRIYPIADNLRSAITTIGTDKGHFFDSGILII